MRRKVAARVRTRAFALARFIRTRPSPRPLRAAGAVLLVLILAVVALLTVVTGGEEPAVTPTAPAADEPATDPSESRDAYSDQSDSEALATDRDQFDGLLDEPPLKWPPDHPGEDVEGYLSEHTAVVTEAEGGRGVIASTLPLVGETPGGDSAPIDLTLVESDGGSLVPRSSVTAVRIPDEATGGLRFPDQDFAIKLVGAESQDASVQSNKAFFPNAVDDGDYLLEPTPAGAELSTVLRSADAQTTIPLQFELSGGQVLRRPDPDDDRLPPGSIELADGSDLVAAVFPAIGVDAAGDDVPVSYELDGDRLSLHVQTDAETTYPVLVDPPVGVYDNYGTSAGPDNLDGYRWKNWRPGTNTDPAGTISPTSWSFCNNQSSFPSRKFYFCQGTLTGSNVTGGALLIKPNSSKSYTTADWGQWVHEAPAGAYIYKLDATSLSNVGPGQAQLSVGVRKADGSNWEWGSVRAANGDQSAGTAVTGDQDHPVPAAYKTPTNVALSGATRYLFVHSANATADITPSEPIAPGNKAVLRMFMSAGTPSASPLPYVTMGGAATYESDTNPPLITDVTHSNPSWSSNAWVDSFTDTVTATGDDTGRGLGMGTVKLTRGGSPIASSPDACPLNGGPIPGGAKNYYDSCSPTASLPAGTAYTALEGVNSYAFTATDLVQNQRTSTPWQVRVDKTPPSTPAFTGGTLTGQDNQPVHGSMTLDVSASDAYSGVQAVKLYVDGNLVDTKMPQPGCDATGCLTSPAAQQLTFDSEAKDANGEYLYAEGTHAIKVTAEDPLAGGPGDHVSAPKEFTVIVDRSEPFASMSGDLDRADDVERFVDTSDPALGVDAHDSLESGEATAGIRSIEVKIDGVDNSPSTQKVEQTCAAPNCGLEHTFDLDVGSLANGTHTVEVVTADQAGNIDDESWDFTIDRASALPLCAIPGSDPKACQPDPPSTSPPTCLPQYVEPHETGGTDVSASEAAEVTDTAVPDARDESESATAEGLSLGPSISDQSNGYVSDDTVQTSALGSSAATYTLGAGTEGLCVAPASTTTDQEPPLANGTATEYANTGASTDTVLRPVPQGIEQTTQIRHDDAPEDFSYQITPQPGRYLKQLSDGTIAVIDSNLPTISGELGPYDASTDSVTDPAAGTGTSDDPEPHGDEPESDVDPSEATPVSNDVPPPDTDANYESDQHTLSVADAEADGQEVAVFTPPTVTDANGASVPAELRLSTENANSFTIQTHYKQGEFAVPIVAKTKALYARHPATTQGKFPYLYGSFGLDAQVGFVGSMGAGDPSDVTNGLNVRPKDGPPPGQVPEGGPALRAGIRADWTRTNLVGPRSCDPWTRDDDPDSEGKTTRDKVNENGGLTGSYGPPIQHSPEWEKLLDNADPHYPPKKPTRLRATYCRAAAEFVSIATKTRGTKGRGLIPYVTINPWKGPPVDTRVAVGTDPRVYVNAVRRLWKTKPFDKVKYWGATNEPDSLLAKEPYGINYAVAVYEGLDDKRKECGEDCHIIAGEFAGIRPALVNYIDRLRNEGRRGRDVPYWAVHDYTDLYKNPDKWPAPGGRERYFPTLQGYLKDLKRKTPDGKDVSFEKAKLLISESGVLLSRKQGDVFKDTPLNGNRALQLRAARRFGDLNTVAPQTLLVSYYQFFGRNEWDGALVDPEGESVWLDGKKFRTAYCVLTGRPQEATDNGLCPDFTH